MNCGSATLAMPAKSAAPEDAAAMTTKPGTRRGRIVPSGWAAAPASAGGGPPRAGRGGAPALGGRRPPGADGRQRRRGDKDRGAVAGGRELAPPPEEPGRRDE